MSNVKLRLGARRIPPVVLIASAVVIGALLLLLWVGFRPSPAPLALKSPKPSATARANSPTPVTADAALAAACREPTATAGGAGPAVRWMVTEGGEAGYRVKEQWASVTLPHEAVARTGRVRGWADVSTSVSGQVLEGACFAVDISSLHSVDAAAVPGMDVAGRDEALGQVVDYRAHPVATLAIQRTMLAPPSQSSAHLQVPGSLQIAGATKFVQFDTQIQRSGDAVSVAGRTTVNRNDFLRFDLSGSPVSIDDQVTVEFSVVLRPASAS